MRSRDRKVVNGFMGAQPEAKVAEFVHELLPPDVTEQADALVAQGDEASLRAALGVGSRPRGRPYSAGQADGWRRAD